MSLGKYLGRDLLTGFVFLLIQASLIRHLVIWNLETDIVFVFFLWLATVRERTHVLVVTAVVALFADILFDTWGIRLFSATFVMLIFHSFLFDPNEQKLSSGSLFTLIFVISLVYTLIFLLLASFSGMFLMDISFFAYWIGGSVYLALTAFILYILKPE